jgi:hypothetical protein
LRAQNVEKTAMPSLDVCAVSNRASSISPSLRLRRFQLGKQHAAVSDTEQTSVSLGKTVHRLIVRKTAGAAVIGAGQTARED